MSADALTGAGPVSGAPVTVVIITKDRTGELLHTLEALTGLPDDPAVIVVDNGSSTDTAAAVHAAFPQVGVIALGHNAGAHGRTIGARRARTPLVAFSDDDSWWAPGSLDHAAELFDCYPRLGLAAARVLVGPEHRLDPTCPQMAGSALGTCADLPGTNVLGFVGCGVVVRRKAFLAVGGFRAQYHIGGEESLVAIDLARAGWGVTYVDALVAHHHPSSSRDGAARRRRIVRNDLWTAWLRRPPRSALRRTVRVLGVARTDPAALLGAVDALRGLRWVVRNRDRVPAWLEEQLATVEG